MTPSIITLYDFHITVFTVPRTNNSKGQLSITRRIDKKNMFESRLQSAILCIFCLASRRLIPASSESIGKAHKNIITRTNPSSVTEPRNLAVDLKDEFLACVDECNSKDFYYADEYVVFLTTRATSYIIVEGKKKSLNVTALKSSILGSNNTYKSNYWKQLPDYEVLPKPVYKNFIKYACLYPAGVTTDTAPIIKFCGNPSSAYTKPPTKLTVAFSLMKPLEKGAAIQRLCQRFVGFWDNIVFNVASFYKDEGLITDIIKKSDNTTVKNKHNGTQIVDNNTTITVDSIFDGKHDIKTKAESKNVTISTNKNTTTAKDHIIITTVVVDKSVTEDTKPTLLENKNITTVLDSNIKVDNSSTVKVKEEINSTITVDTNTTDITAESKVKQDTVPSEKQIKNTTDLTAVDATVKEKKSGGGTTQHKKPSTEAIENTTDSLKHGGDAVISSAQSDQQAANDSEPQETQKNYAMLGVLVVGLSALLGLVAGLLMMIYVSEKKSWKPRGKAVKVEAIPGVVSAVSGCSSLHEKVEMTCVTFDESRDRGCVRFRNPLEENWSSAPESVVAEPNLCSQGFPIIDEFPNSQKTKDQPLDWDVDALSWGQQEV